jgi:phosphohistidine swiveling domain-containing protein
VLGRLDGNQRRQFEPLLARARRLCRAVDVAWDGLARVMAAAQLWLRAVAAEAVSAGLIADPAEVHFLELEELKQVATGEWHRGRSERVREEVVQRQADLAARSEEPARPPMAASPGTASGPAFRFELASDIALLPGSLVLTRVAASGDAPYWLSAAGVIDAAGDPWGPGMIVARALAVPAVTGMPASVAQVAPGQSIAVDGSAGRVEIGSPIPLA